MRLGIDFGTTRIVVALRDRGNFPVVTFRSDAGDPIEHYPTYVAERAGVLRFGLAAEAVRDDPEWSLVRSFKRWLSAPDARPDRMVRVGQTSLTLLALTTRFLAALREDLATSSNVPRRAQKDGRFEAIIAVPANAHNAQRFITIEAFRAAGFEVVALMNEPTAGAVEYAYRHESTLTKNRDSVLVYDLGGGTFDVSLVKVGGGQHEVVATRGIQELGGDDFDRALLRLATDRMSDRLLEHCREQKESLHPNSRRVIVELDDGPVTIETKDYYEACAPLVMQTLEVVEALLETHQIDQVAGLYVVGGASALPVVARMLRAKYGRRVHRSVYPSASTAIGLAIAFDEELDVSVAERFSRHFGVFREGADGAEVTFDPIFAAQAALPSGGEVLQVERRYRPVHNVGHFRYVECGWLDDAGVPARQITPFADVRFPFDPRLRQQTDLSTVPVQRVGEGPLIEERYTVDAAGIVTLQIADLDNDFAEAFQLSSS